MIKQLFPSSRYIFRKRKGHIFLYSEIATLDEIVHTCGDHEKRGEQE